MSRACTIDGRKVPCPNASLIAGARGAAKPGDMLVWNDPGFPGRKTLARMLGRVTAPADGPDVPAIKGWILAMVLSEDASFAYERWINPADVARVYDSPAKLAAVFFAPKLPHDARTMLRLIEHGTMSDRFIDFAPERVAEWKARAAYQESLVRAIAPEVLRR